MAKQLRLAPRRLKWAEERSGGVLVGSILRQDIRAENRYAKQLEGLVLRMGAEVRREIAKFFRQPYSKEFFGEDEAIPTMDDTVASQARILINKLSEKYITIFNQAGKRFANSMLKEQCKVSGRVLRDSMKKLSGGLTLKMDIFDKDINDIIKASITENVELIRSIPEEFFLDIGGDLMRSITNPQGKGWQGVAENLEKRILYRVGTEEERDKLGTVGRRARNIALDQTRKAFNSINVKRMEAVGIKKYRWVHSFGGQQPRQMHIEMNGNIYSLDDPPLIDYMYGEPVYGHPGHAINCRCTMVPIIEF